MVCFSPLKGFRSRDVNASGKRSIVFNGNSGYADLPVDVPCGQCIGCRIARSRMWAVRCIHEASLHERNCFITLTYDDAHLPEGGTLVLKHFQDFMKRVRKRYGEGIRFFHCGEYGEDNQRPHYHAILFNLDFEDKYVFKKGEDAESVLWRSPTLEELWPFGFSTVGTVTFKSAAYCARYIMKKMTGEYAIVYQPHVDSITGEVFGERLPPYITMSRRPGIAKHWFDKFKSDVYPDDFVVLLDGTRVATPKFYDKQLPEKELRVVKRERMSEAMRRADDNTPDRLRVREEVTMARLSKLKREL